MFEKVQDLPTQGAESVEHFTIDSGLYLAFANNYGDIKRFKTSSMVYKMDELTGKFSLYQKLQTRGANDIKYFAIANKHFITVTNHYDDGNRLMDSVIYQWNGKLFVVFQKIPTKGGSHSNFFTLNGDKYLAVTNYFDGKSGSIRSVIFKWRSGKFSKFQEIPTERAAGCVSFVINSVTFIAFANQYNSQQKHSVQSTVFKWSGGRFVKFQSLQTYGADDVKSFKINDHIFLAFANHYSGSSHKTNSFIYKWDGNMFHLFQSIPTLEARTLYPFVISGQTYLGVANAYFSSKKPYTQSVVYQASGARFIKYQEIPTHGGWDMAAFEYKGHTYLAVANRYSKDGKYNANSALYKWV